MTGTPQASSPSEQASFHLVHERGRAVVIAAGEVDLMTAPALRKAIDAAAATSKRLVIDLEAVSFLDSSGIGALLHAQRLGCESVVLVSPTALVRRVLEVTQLDRICPVYESRQDAMDHGPDPTVTSA